MNHTTDAVWFLDLGANLAVHIKALPRNVLRAAEAVVDDTGTERRIGDAVDQDEGAGLAVGRIGIERHRLVSRKGERPNLVELQRLGRALLKRVDVGAELEVGDGHRHLLRAELQQV